MRIIQTNKRFKNKMQINQSIEKIFFYAQSCWNIHSVLSCGSHQREDSFDIRTRRYGSSLPSSAVWYTGCACVKRRQQSAAEMSGISKESFAW